MAVDQICPMPTNETQRIDTLRSYQILDTEPSLEFEAITRISSHTFDTPIAVVALLDTDRLWFKSKLGLNVHQLDRKVAFCAHTIMSPREPLIVNDLIKDQRFISNPLVASAPHLRFYAGVPLVNSSNHVLGTVAVIDSQPRVFSTSQREALCDFGVIVMNAIESHKRAVELKQFALTDYLTGIPNRAQFDITNSAETAYAVRSGVPYSLICMDLDGFKQINDQFGHPTGDQVLFEVARRLSQQMRPGDLLARLGGDEFAVVARFCGHDDAIAMVRRLKDSIRSEIQLANGAKVRVGISVGTATSSPACTGASELFDQADKALYLNKLR